MNDLRQLHADFDYYYDKEKMDNKLKSRWYNPEDVDNAEDVVFSTDFTDEADDLMYKRYKINYLEQKETIQEYQEAIADMSRRADEWFPESEKSENIDLNTGESSKYDLNVLISRTREEHATLKTKNVHVETAMSKMKMAKKRKYRVDGEALA